MITRNGLDITQIGKDIKDSFVNSILAGAGVFPSENILHRYKTFNYRITFGIISSAERKSQSYKMTGMDYIIFQSHGKNADGITPGSSKTLNQIQSFVNMVTAGGKNNYNFHLEELYIKSAMSASRDWATDVRIKVIEPYSMDTFLTAITSGITAKGYASFDKSVNFLLKIDFVGYQEDSDEPEVIPFTTRYYPLSLITLNANLTTQGTAYEIVAMAMNDTGRLDDANVVSEPLKVSGKTVGDVMESLQRALNGLAEARKADSDIVSDEYFIKFVDESGNVVQASDTASCITGKIKAAKMANPNEDAGVKEFLKDKSKYTAVKTTTKFENEEEDTIILTVDGRLGITTIIDGLICDSRFLLDRMKVEFKGYYDEDNQVPWWRVTTSVENGSWIASQNKYQRKITFSIIPRKVHYTKLTTTFKPDHVTTPSDYQSMVARTYEWNYTGNNKDILTFNLNFNQLWAKIITSNYGKKPQTQGSNLETISDNPVVIKNPDGTSLKSNAINGTLDPNSSGLGLKAPMLSGTTTGWQPSTNSSKPGQVRTSAETNPLYDLGRDIFAIINNPNEQIMLDMEILGDPMWLGTQFIDDGSKMGSGSKLFTVDGGIAIRTVDPIIRVLAYAPRDVNSEGFIAPENGESKSLSKYSAHYTVIEVDSYFQNGVFKQKLKANRNSMQDMAALKATENSGDRISWNKIDLSIRGNTQNGNS